MDAIKVCDLFDLTHTRAAKMLAACEYPWEALSKIGETVLAIGQGLDLSDYDSAQGRYELYDVIATHDLWKPIMDIVERDFGDVMNMYYRLSVSAKRNFEAEHSLTHRVGKVFESLLGTENLTDTVAHAEQLNSRLIDMLGAMRKEQTPGNVTGLKLAKRAEE